MSDVTAVVAQGPGLGSQDAHREPFTTIDDCIRSADKLADSLRRLGAQKRPLDVRKGLRVVEARNDASQALRATSRTYFFDIKPIQNGGKCLVVTESCPKDKHRSQVTIYLEDAQLFLNTLVQAISGLAE